MQKTLRGPALSKAVRDYVKQYILDHKLQGGDPLPPETQLAQDLGVGRSSVREAVKALQSLGIVEVDDSDLESLCRELIEANPRVVDDVKNGKLKAAGSLIGQAKKRNPNVDPGRVRELCIRLIQEP
jgi:DNA-binding transcriptional MocR family regulator